MSHGSQRTVQEIYSPNQKLAHGWKCSVNDVMKLSPLWCCDLSHNMVIKYHQWGENKSNQQRGQTFTSCPVYPGLRPYVPARKANKCSFGYFLFRPGCDASRHRRFINTHNYTCPWIRRSCVVNIFARKGCYSHTVQAFLRWTQACLCVTVCLCWEEAWPTSAWHFIKQISGTLRPRACRDVQRGGVGCRFQTFLLSCC